MTPSPVADEPGRDVGSDAAEPAKDGAADAGDDATADPVGDQATSTPARSWRTRSADPVPAKKGRWWELPVLVIVAVAVAVVVKTFVVQPFYIPSGSMEKTLHGCPGCSGDKILVNKPIFDVRSPRPGDIVVFSRPTAWPPDPGESPVAPKTNAITGPVRWFGQLVGVVPPDREDLVKRVIATGGQAIRCCDAQGRVQVSPAGPGGPFRSLSEPYVDFFDPITGRNGVELPFGPVTVPHGRLWVMGDHRVDSADSRFHCVAGTEAPPVVGQVCDPVSSTVPISRVIGKAVVIVWPVSRWRTLGTPGTFASAAGSAPLVPPSVGVLAAAPLWWYRRRGDA